MSEQAFKLNVVVPTRVLERKVRLFPSLDSDFTELWLDLLVA